MTDVPITPVLTKRWTTDESWLLSTYEDDGGYQALRKALGTPQDDLIQMVKDSSLRGRGGAGFPTGMKWAFIPQDDGKPHYLVVNADEGEPGTCRDLPLMMADPHALIEGIAICCYAVRANHAFIYIRGEAVHALRRVQNAVREAYAKGYVGENVLGSGFDLEVTVHPGAGAYICGEETALLDSLEGYRGQPRLKPPFPATHGLYQSPTVVNNVGTLASVPHIVNNGADWWKTMGPDKSPGTSIFSLSGRVKRPGQYEAPMGTTLRELLDMAGGVPAGRDVKFWTPGGASTPLFTAEHLDVPLDFDSVPAAGSINGTSAIMIFDDSDCVVRAVKRWSEFYAHESCGKCTPCREGTFWYVQIYNRLERGDASEKDLDTLLDLSDNILGRAFCALGDGAVAPVTSSLQYFRDEYVAHYEQGGCPFRGRSRARATALAGSES
jgi:NADH-quinone oxidoreductase subunit F